MPRWSKYTLTESKLRLGYRAQPSRNDTGAAKKLGLYICQCWCGRNYVWVNGEDLRQGYTYGCGRPKCQRTHKHQMMKRKYA